MVFIDIYTVENKTYELL